ncbi:MAG TPA: DUF2304 domain-containing protein [Solirubrobacteraceae bacterium]|nr:DUF2304 domain-containing protein [Solirubrobacteraceae bacterium]
MTSLSLQRGLAVAVTLALLLFVFELVRRKHLSERYSILWLLASATLFVLAAWKGLLTSLSHDVGIDYPPSALFAVAIGLIVVLLMYFSLVVSRLTDQNKILAQRLALLQQRVEQAVEGSAGGAGKRELFSDRQPGRQLAPDAPDAEHADALARAGREAAVAEELSSSR